MTTRLAWRWALAGGLALLLALAAAVFALNRLDEAPLNASGTAERTTERAAASVEQIARGAYLARAGNCAGCHTARGGAPFAGGGPVATPFGTVFAANLTPDPATGLGRWSAATFWRALHNGRSADGRLLVPACPYPNFTLIRRDDADDLFAYLGSLQPVKQAPPAHALRFPYGTQPALAVWRALFFRPGAAPLASPRSSEWERGAYLVGGLGHCSACHGQRNAWGATGGAFDLRGGRVQGWLAPALDDPQVAGVAGWPLEDVVALLKSGRTEHAGVSGPMAMVVARSTQHLDDGDLRAMAAFLQSLPSPAPRGRPEPAAAEPPPAEMLALGGRLYERHCASCHGDAGEGRPPQSPRLAGNRAVMLASPANVIKVVLGGGFGPATAGHPRPHGMPPYATLLSDAEIAAVVSYVRASWGHRAAPVSALEVNRQRGG
jgi:mono/diheme cytochrome c family protein